MPVPALVIALVRSSAHLDLDAAGRSDHVTASQPGVLGRRSGGDVGDEDAVVDLEPEHLRQLVVDEAGLHADERALDVLAGLELFEDRLGSAHADRESDVLGLRRTGRVHADDRAVEGQQRPTGVARVDRGVGLDQVVEVFAVVGGDRTVERRHDSGRGGRTARQGQRVADRDDGHPDGELIRVTQRERVQAGPVDLDDRQVVGGVGAEHRAVDGAARRRT